jgi:hypothetical protein
MVMSRIFVFELTQLIRSGAAIGGGILRVQTIRSLCRLPPAGKLTQLLFRKIRFFPSTEFHLRTSEIAKMTRS